MNKLFTATGAAVACLALFASAAFAATVNYTPWTFDPANACNESATVNGSSVTLSKPCPTATVASAGVSLEGVNGLSTTGMTLSFDYDGYCGAGAPRFNVHLSNGAIIFLGCAHGDADNDGTATFTAGQTYGGVLFPEGQTVTAIDIVQDEQGTVTLSNITINGDVASPNLQALRDSCKNGGWRTMTGPNGQSFRNQGDCVSFFSTGGQNQPSGTTQNL